MSTEFALNLFEFGDNPGNGIWLDGHYRQHLRYNAVLAGRSPPVLLNTYPILYVAPGTIGRRDWLDSHEKWHEQVRGFANVTGVDLSVVNLDNEAEFYQWLDLHNYEHSLLDKAFGVA